VRSPGGPVRPTRRPTRSGRAHGGGRPMKVRKGDFAVLEIVKRYTSTRTVTEHRTYELARVGSATRDGRAKSYHVNGESSPTQRDRIIGLTNAYHVPAEKVDADGLLDSIVD